MLQNHLYCYRILMMHVLVLGFFFYICLTGEFFTWQIVIVTKMPWKKLQGKNQNTSKTDVLEQAVKFCLCTCAEPGSV